MRQIFLHCLPLTLVGLPVLIAPAPAQEKAADAKVMEIFFDLGLPEVKGGKWSRVFTMDSEGGESLPATRNARYSGNAWLMKDERGVIEAVTSDGRVIRGKKANGDAEDLREVGGLSQAQVQPANLDDDLKLFMAALKSHDTRRSRGDDDAQGVARVAGGALIFLAQLQRQGRDDFVRGALPLVLASVPSPETALDGAVSLIADGRLASLARTWAEKGDAAAYAAGIEKLAVTFPRGWSHRDAALFLAAGLREQKASPAADDTAAQLAAKLLLGLKPAQFRELPIGRNWFIAGARGRSRMGGFPDGLPGLDGPDGLDGADDADVGQPAKKSAEITAFFADKRASALALAKLLDDHRYLRTATRPDGGSSRYSRFSSGGRKSQEQVIREQYARLPRPPELGEVAWTLLSPLLPEGVREAAEEKPESRAVSALVWLKGAAAKNDEEIAWDYLRNSQQTYQDEFSGSLGFLVEKGGADTLAKLREVFLDPAVWGGGVDQIAEPLEKFIKRAPADPAFADKLRASVKAALDAQEADQRRYSSDDMTKHFAAQRTAQMKRLDQFFKPPQPVAEQLAEIVAMEETESLAAFGAIGQSLAKKPVAEIEAPIFQAAAKAKPVPLKSEMLQLLMNTVMRGPRGQSSAAGTATSAVPAAPAAREAMLALLRDQTQIPNEYDPASSFSVSEMTAWVLLALHSPQSQDEWQRLGTSVPHLAKKWMQLHALALAEGKPVPPIPGTAKLAAGRAAALVGELGALPAAQIAAAFAGKPPDEQVAIAEHLQAAAEWPAPIIEAHFSVTEFSGAKGIVIGGPEWKGRRFDEKFVREIQAAVENSGAAGKPCAVDVSGGEPFAGVRITVVESPRKLPADQFAGYGLPGMSGKPAPVAFAYFGFMGDGKADEGPKRFGYGFPIWKDAAVTRTWRDEHGKTTGKDAGKKATEDPVEETMQRRLPTDPAPFDQVLRAALAFKKEARGKFRFTFSAIGIGTEKLRAIPAVPGL